MDLIFKHFFLAFFFFQNTLFCNKINHENFLKNISTIFHKFDGKLRHLKKIKFFVQKYAINGQLKSALLLKIKEVEQKLLWFDNFSPMLPLLKPKASAKFDVKIDFLEQIMVSIDQEIKAIELATNNLLKLSLDGLCPNLDLNFLPELIEQHKEKPEIELKKGLLLDDGTDSIGEGLAETIGQVAGGPVYGPVVGKVAKVTAKKVTKALTLQSCWATSAECEKHWVHLSLDVEPTLDDLETEVSFWHNLSDKIPTFNACSFTKLSKSKLLESQEILVEEQNKLKQKMAICQNIKSFENQIIQAKAPVNTEIEVELIDVLKRLIDLRMNQIHYLNARKTAGAEAEKEIKALVDKISRLKSAISERP